MVCRVVKHCLQEFTTPPKDYSIQSLVSIVLFQEMYQKMRLEIWHLSFLWWSEKLHFLRLTFQVEQSFQCPVQWSIHTWRLDCKLLQRLRRAGCSLASLGDCPVEVIKNCQWFMTLDPLRRDTCQTVNSIHKADTWDEDLFVCADFLDKQSLTSWLSAEFDAPYMLEISSPCRSLFFLPSVVAAWRHYRCPLALFGRFDDVWGVDKLLITASNIHPLSHLQRLDDRDVDGRWNCSGMTTRSPTLFGKALLMPWP